MAAVQRSTDATPVTLARRAWAYDSAGNRTVEQADDAVFHSAHDALNRLLGRAPGGGVVFAGTVSEPASVTIGGQRATVDSGNAFRGVAAVSTGTSVVTVRAVDPSGNVATQARCVRPSFIFVILASGSCGCVQLSFEPFFFR